MKHTVIYTLPIILILFSCDPSLPYKEMYYDAMDEIIELKDQIEQLEEEKEHKINEINNFGINLKRATSRDYSKWLNGYLSIDGNKCTHNYNYPLPNGEFYIATEDFEFKKPLYGASSIYIIVEKGVKVGGLENIGHCKLYFMDEYKSYDDYFIPSYSDLKIEPSFH